MHARTHTWVSLHIFFFYVDHFLKIHVPSPVLSSLLHRLFSSCSAWVSHCGGFSWCGVQALGCMGFDSCGSWALKNRLSSCREQAWLLWAMWDLPGSSTEPVSPALAGGFFTTELTGSPHGHVAKLALNDIDVHAYPAPVFHLTVNTLETRAAPEHPWMCHNDRCPVMFQQTSVPIGSEDLQLKKSGMFLRKQLNSGPWTSWWNS